MVSTALGMGLGWDSFLSSCTVTTLSNLEMPYTVMVPTIFALYHSGVGAVVSPVSFFYLAVICLLFVLFYPILN